MYKKNQLNILIGPRSGPNERGLIGSKVFEFLMVLLREISVKKTLPPLKHTIVPIMQRFNPDTYIRNTEISEQIWDIIFLKH